MNLIMFLIGAAAMLLFFVAYEMGKQTGNKPTKQISPLTDDDEHELEQQKERAKAINKDFQKLMAYNVEQAMESEKVM